MKYRIPNRMPLLRSSLVCFGIAMAGTSAWSGSLFDKISDGASKAAEKAEGAVKTLEQNVESTIDLAKGEDSVEAGRQVLDQVAEETLTRLFAENPSAQELFEQSAGYAVFDTRKMVLLGVAAGFGRGVAVSRDTGLRTYMKMGTGGVGLSFGLGGLDTQIVILFETAAAFEDFVTQGYDATADAGAMFGDDREDASVRFEDGRSIFVLSNKGWKVRATAAGTKYWADPDLN